MFRLVLRLAGGDRFVARSMMIGLLVVLIIRQLKGFVVMLALFMGMGMT